jgi:hypothetical protein
MERETHGEIITVAVELEPIFEYLWQRSDL